MRPAWPCVKKKKEINVKDSQTFSFGIEGALCSLRRAVFFAEPLESEDSSLFLLFFHLEASSKVKVSWCVERKVLSGAVLALPGHLALNGEVVASHSSTPFASP